MSNVGCEVPAGTNAEDSANSPNPRTFPFASRTSSSGTEASCLPSIRNTRNIAQGKAENVSVHAKIGPPDV